jgi:hypothetical protein
MEERLATIEMEASFKFCCSPQRICFNECCRDLNQFLTPYDVMRLKNCLGLSSRQFLTRYTRRHTGPGSGLPIVTLIPDHSERLTCPFVTPAGCRVYTDRPSSCRTYPLVRILRRSRDSGDVLEEYRILNEPHCRGFDAVQLQTVREWISNQGLIEYNTENDRLLELISLKARLSSKALPPSLADQVYVALYDLDRFREQLCAGGLAGMPTELIENARIDEVARLHLGMEWAKTLLEKTFSR